MLGFIEQTLPGHQEKKVAKSLTQDEDEGDKHEAMQVTAVQE